MLNMENSEEVLQILERYTRLKQKEIPRELDDYLLYVAKTGDTIYSWTNVKYLFREKLLSVIKDFPNIDDLPQYPNVDPFNYEGMKSTLLERLDLFNAAPFTVQRLCELLTDPKKQYSRIDKFMRALEKNILVSTIEPGRKHTESENGDLSLDDTIELDMENDSIFTMATPTTTQNNATSSSVVEASDATAATTKQTANLNNSHKSDDDILPNPKKQKLNVDEAKEANEKEKIEKIVVVPAVEVAVVAKETKVNNGDAAESQESKDDVKMEEEKAEEVTSTKKEEEVVKMEVEKEEEVVTKMEDDKKEEEIKDEPMKDETDAKKEVQKMDDAKPEEKIEIAVEAKEEIIVETKIEEEERAGIEEKIVLEEKVTTSDEKTEEAEVTPKPLEEDAATAIEVEVEVEVEVETEAEAEIKDTAPVAVAVEEPVSAKPEDEIPTSTEDKENKDENKIIPEIVDKTEENEAETASPIVPIIAVPEEGKTEEPTTTANETETEIPETIPTEKEPIIAVEESVPIVESTLDETPKAEIPTVVDQPMEENLELATSTTPIEAVAAPAVEPIAVDTITTTITSTTIPTPSPALTPTPTVDEVVMQTETEMTPVSIADAVIVAEPVSQVDDKAESAKMDVDDTSQEAMDQ